MVYSEHRFLPNLGCVRSHPELPASDLCCQAQDESLGDEKHFFHMFLVIFSIPSHPSRSMPFVYNFLGRHRLQLSAMQHGGEAVSAFARLEYKGKHLPGCQSSLQLLTMQLLIMQLFTMPKAIKLQILTHVFNPILLHRMQSLNLLLHLLSTCFFSLTLHYISI